MPMVPLSYPVELYNSVPRSDDQTATQHDDPALRIPHDPALMRRHTHTNNLIFWIMLIHMIFLALRHFFQFLLPVCTPSIG